MNDCPQKQALSSTTIICCACQLSKELFHTVARTDVHNVSPSMVWSLRYTLWGTQQSLNQLEDMRLELWLCCRSTIKAWDGTPAKLTPTYRKAFCLKIMIQVAVSKLHFKCTSLSASGGKASGSCGDMAGQSVISPWLLVFG